MGFRYQKTVTSAQLIGKGKDRFKFQYSNNNDQWLEMNAEYNMRGDMLYFRQPVKAKYFRCRSQK